MSPNLRLSSSPKTTPSTKYPCGATALLLAQSLSIAGHPALPRSHLTRIAVRYRAGAVIPFLPLRHLPVVGLASKSYSFLGFRIAPGAQSGFGAVYEDDGATTAYLDGHYGFTTLDYSASPSSFSALISPSANSTSSLVQRSYQVGGGLASPCAKRLACVRFL